MTSTENVTQDVLSNYSQDQGIELREGYADVGDGVKLHYVEAAMGR